MPKFNRSTSLKYDRGNVDAGDSAGYYTLTPDYNVQVNARHRRIWTTFLTLVSELEDIIARACHYIMRRTKRIFRRLFVVGLVVERGHGER